MTKVVIVVAMITLSFISPRLLELKIYVVNANKEGTILLWMTAQVVIVVGMITSSFITSKVLQLEINIDNDPIFCLWIKTIFNSTPRTTLASIIFTMLQEMWSWHDYVLISCSHHEASVLNIARIIYICITDNFEITILVLEIFMVLQYL